MLTTQPFTPSPGPFSAPAGGRIGWLLVLALLAGCSTQGRPQDPGPGDSQTPPTEIHNTGTQNQTLEQLLAQEDFDLPRALLLFSEKHYPQFAGKPSHDTDLRAKLARFDAYAADLRNALRRDKSPRQRLLTLRDFVHAKLGLRFDTADPSGHDPENLFFDRVLQNRKGYCVTLSLAYIVFGQAAGLDVAGIRVPTHFVVRYRDIESDGQKFETLIETTAQGETQEDTYYWAKYRFSATSVEAGAYLTPLTDRQIFGTLYNNLAGLSHLRGNDLLAIEQYDRALELAPNNCEAMYNRAIVLRRLKRDRDALKDFNAALRTDPNFVHAYLARARLLYESGEKEQAREDLGEAMRKRPDWPEPQMLNGIFLAKDGELDAAKAAFLKVLQIDNGFNSARLAIAELERARGNHTEARKWEQEAGKR
ncbi:MAG: tetratricopeptide repeat protein [Planctomycetes bacterium]|nr:tetratricopeptide repeat protein [Planctomycetota bacterium]